MKTLRDARPGDDVVVKKVHGDSQIKQRLMDMGVVRGAKIHVRKVAPLGDPIEVNLRSYELSLRKVESESIEVE